VSTATLATPAVAISMLRGICAANKLVIAFAVRVRQSPGVREVATSVDSRDLVSGPYIALYTDVELECARL
jgi:uncharacterized lipoprotein YajG